LAESGYIEWLYWHLIVPLRKDVPFLCVPIDISITAYVL